MSEASWLWRYKQNSVENRVFWKICVLAKKSRCANMTVTYARWRWLNWSVKNNHKKKGGNESRLMVCGLARKLADGEVGRLISNDQRSVLILKAVPKERRILLNRVSSFSIWYEWWSNWKKTPMQTDDAGATEVEIKSILNFQAFNLLSVYKSVYLNLKL